MPAELGDNAQVIQQPSPFLDFPFFLQSVMVRRLDGGLNGASAVKRAVLLDAACRVQSTVLLDGAGRVQGAVTLKSAGGVQGTVTLEGAGGVQGA